MYTSLKIVKKLEFAWMYYPNGLTTGFAISKGYITGDDVTGLLQIVEQGKTKRPDVLLSTVTVLDEYGGGTEKTFATFAELQEELVLLNNPLMQTENGGDYDSEIAALDDRVSDLESLPLGSSITSQTGFTVVDTEFTFNPNWTWNIVMNQHTNANAVVVNVPLAEVGKRRIEYIVPNDQNTFERIPGQETTGIPIAPTLPNYGMYATYFIVTELGLLEISGPNTNNTPNLDQVTQTGSVAKTPISVVDSTTGKASELSSTAVAFKNGSIEVSINSDGVTESYKAQLPNKPAGVETIAMESDIIASAQDMQLISNMQNNWNEDISGEKYPQHTLVRDSLIDLTTAFGCSGLVSKQDSFLLSDLNTTTLRLSANNEPFLFYNKIATDYANCLKLFPQQDFLLANIPGITVDGTYLRYVAYLDDGTVHFSQTSFSLDDNYCQVGRIAIKRVGGVITFIDAVGSNRNVKTIPDLAGYNDLQRLYAPLASNVELKPNANMTMQHAGGTITGVSINWQGADNNARGILAQNPVQFSRLDPSANTSTTPPAIVTALITSNYWNGTALVPLTANGNASVQRILIGDNSNIVVQVGEFQYDNFAEAKDAFSVAPFTAILPKASYVEIGRIVAVKNTTNLQDENQAQFYASAGIGGGGGGSASAGTDISISYTATTVLVNSSTGLDGAIGLATATHAGLLGPGAQTIYGDKTFDSKILIKQTDGAGAGTIESSTAGILLTKDGANSLLAITGSNLIMYKTNSIQATIAAQNLTVSHTFFLPNKDGTFAMTSDLHNALTLGTANGLQLATQVLSLGLAGASATGALSSTDWNTFNNKQPLLVNPITGIGTTNYLPKFTSAGVLGDSQIIDNGTNVLIGTTTDNGTDRLQVEGNGIFTGELKSVGYITGYLGLIIGQTNDEGTRIIFRGAQSSKNFQIANNWNSPATLEITSSDTQGGIDFTTPIVAIKGNTGNVLINTTTDNGVDKLQVNGSISGTKLTIAQVEDDAVNANSTNGAGVKASSIDGDGVISYSTNGVGVIAYSVNNKALIANIPTENTSNIAEFKKNGVNQVSISHDGKITANSFIKSGGTNTQYLMADGSVLSGIAVILINEGNGIGTVFGNVDRANYGNIGLDAFDFSYSDSPSGVFGATGEQSFAVGINVIASSYNSTVFGYNSESGGIGDFVTGFNIVTQGYTNFVTGIGHDIIGTNITVIGQAAEFIDNSIITFNDPNAIVFAVGNGTIADNDPDYTVTSRSTAFSVKKSGQINIKDLQFFELPSDATAAGLVQGDLYIQSNTNDVKIVT